MTKHNDPLKSPSNDPALPQSSSIDRFVGAATVFASQIHAPIPVPVVRRDIKELFDTKAIPLFPGEQPSPTDPNKWLLDVDERRVGTPAEKRSKWS